MEQARLSEAKRLSAEAVSLWNQKRPEMAMSKRAMAICDEGLAGKRPETSACLTIVGATLVDLDPAATRSCLERALALDKELLGEKHTETMTALANLAKFHHHLQNYPAARPYFEQVLAIRKELSGEKSLETARALHDLGSLLKDMGDFHDGAADSGRGLGDSQGGPSAKSTPRRRESLRSSGTTVQAMGDPAAALPTTNRPWRFTASDS